MKKIFVIFLFCWSGHVVAEQETTKRECLRRCGELKGGTTGALFDAKMKVINEKKAIETDPLKLEALKQEAERQTDRYEREHDKMCHAICDGNPDN